MRIYAEQPLKYASDNVFEIRWECRTILRWEHVGIVHLKFNLI